MMYKGSSGEVVECGVASCSMEDEAEGKCGIELREVLAGKAEETTHDRMWNDEAVVNDLANSFDGCNIAESQDEKKYSFALSEEVLASLLNAKFHLMNSASTNYAEFNEEMMRIAERSALMTRNKKANSNNDSSSAKSCSNNSTRNSCDENNNEEFQAKHSAKKDETSFHRVDRTSNSAYSCGLPSSPATCNSTCTASTAFHSPSSFCSSFSASSSDEEYANEVYIQTLQKVYSKHLQELNFETAIDLKNTFKHSTASVTWPIALLKIYQIFVDLLPLNSLLTNENCKQPSAEEDIRGTNTFFCGSDTGSLQDQSSSSSSNKFSRSSLHDKYFPPLVYRQTNVWQTSVLYEILQKAAGLACSFTENFTATAVASEEFKDYTYKNCSQLDATATSCEPSSLPFAMEEKTVNLCLKLPLKVNVILKSGVWSNLNISASADNSAEERAEIEREIVQWNLECKTLSVCIDVDFIVFACECLGRYDAYILALMCYILQTPHSVPQSYSFIQIPKFFFVKSLKMARKRAAHALRVFRDFFKSRITKEKYQWYLTLLTSGSVEAVEDTLADLESELWHAQFNKKDFVSLKRLEKLLVALLGHSDIQVRNKVIVLLNNFFDNHDWQKTVSFKPIIKSVGDSFTLEILIDDSTNPYENPQGPNNIFLILNSPSFFKEAKLEIYSYHSLVWICEDEKYKHFLNNLTNDAKSASAQSHSNNEITQKDNYEQCTKNLNDASENYKNVNDSSDFLNSHKKFRWKGIIDFGKFKRCGFYDWRVVRANENDGSLNVLQITTLEFQRNSSVSFSKKIGNLSEEREESYTVDEGCSSANDGVNVNISALEEKSVLHCPSFKGDFHKSSKWHQAITEIFPLQGRWIVQPPNIMEEQIHEVFIDQHDARWDSDTGELTQRGSFSSLVGLLKRFKECGITAVYIMGALARDNGDIVYTNHGDLTYERPDASPFAVTCRATPNEMLGGVVGFLDLMKEAKRVGIKIIIDSLSRISSSRPHRKYWPLILHTLDEQGKKIMLYGTDGRSLSYEDTTMLNYRKVEAWDLLINDLKVWTSRMAIDGVRLDNAQTWPPIMQLDEKELNRLDADGQSHYCPDDRLLGEVVIPFTENNCGFWGSDASQFYANPFFVKLCKEMWLEAPHFMIIGECWGGRGLKNRPGALVKSGVIPQLQQLPYTLCKLFAKEINNDGCVVNLPRPMSVLVLKEWFDECHRNLCEGSVILQSSCSHSSPLPGLLYGRGAWPSIDLLFLLPDVPCTFAGEMEGMAFRLDVANVYQTSEILRHKNNDEFDTLNNHDYLTPCSALLSKLPYTHSEGFVKGHSASTVSLVNLNDNTINKNASGDAEEGISSLSKSSNNRISRRALLTRVRSLSKFESVTNLPALEEEHIRKLGPEHGFDLKKIKGHYDHRRMLRRKFKVFTVGKLAPLKAMHDNGLWLSHVLAFLRIDLDSFEFALVAINFSSNLIEDIHVSLNIINKYFQIYKCRLNYQEDEVIFQCRNLLNTKLDGTCDSFCELFSLNELLCETQVFNLQPYSSVCLLFSILHYEKSNIDSVIRKLYISSVDRIEKILRKRVALSLTTTHMSDKVSSLKIQLTNNYAFYSLLSAIQPGVSLDVFANVLDCLHFALSHRCSSACSLFSDTSSSISNSSEPNKKNFSLLDICVDSGLFAENDDMLSLLVAKMQKLSEGHKDFLNYLSSKQLHAELAFFNKNVPGAIQLTNQFLKNNYLGHLVFVTPELGRWSTVGGLGVMVDELCCTLAQNLEQDVWVISPYYHTNRKGETDYMTRDITHSFNITIQVAKESITLGVHEGRVKDVRLFFIHNAKYFPHPYPTLFGCEAVKSLVVIAKSALEVICHLRQIPQLIVTNDWPTSLIPAYAKNGQFGDVFNNTTFFHIIHNLDVSYEGRIYCNKSENMNWIHGLQSDLLVDPNWQQYVINPSRCALLQCDAWGTVSPTYRDDLCGRNSGHNPSPLAPLLNRYPSPFAYPNGIPIESREARLRSTGCANHEEAKSKLQMRYFGFSQPDIQIPLFAFIGRITAQKGIHLILEATENIIRRYESKIQILIGGRASSSDSYSFRCAQKMFELKEKYPWSFWADPNEFFVDGPLVNLGADFGLMPSAFEPGGIVQHEFFIAGTPVIAYRTGGLKDTVFEFNLETHTGNGFTFESYNLGDFLYAIERAIRLFRDSTKYSILRKNARASVISCEEVARAWLGEFCRLRRKLAVNTEKVKSLLNTMDPWNEREFLAKKKKLITYIKESDNVASSSTGSTALSNDYSLSKAIFADNEAIINSNTSIINADTSNYRSLNDKIIIKPTQVGPIPTSPPILCCESLSLPNSSSSYASSLSCLSFSSTGGGIPCSLVSSSRGILNRPNINMSCPSSSSSAAGMRLTPCRIKFNSSPGNRSSRPRSVAVAGSFDDWRVRRPLTWDNALQAFTISIALKPGKYLYKLIVNGDWICNADEPTEKDSMGNINNVLIVS